MVCVALAALDRGVGPRFFLKNSPLIPSFLRYTLFNTFTNFVISFVSQGAVLRRRKVFLVKRY